MKLINAISKPVLRVFLLAPALFIVNFLSCQSPGANEEPDFRIFGEIDNIFFISIDTLRADHLGCYGYIRDTSPFIDSVAAQGIIFDRCFSSSATTLPSHTSMLTALWPAEHGVTRNKLKLGANIPTIMEQFRAWGFKTAGFSATGQFQNSKLTRGFDYYHGQSGKEFRQNQKLVWNAEDMAGFVENWLSSVDPSEKHFTFIHFYDVHTPLNPPQEILDRFNNKDVSTRQAFREFLFSRHHLPKDVTRLNELIKESPLQYRTLQPGEDIFDVHGRYDAEISYVDSQLRRLYRAFTESGLNDNSLWIITSDHGEGLGNHYFMMHGMEIYPEQVRVPLIFFSPQVNRGGLRRTEIVQHTSLFKTLIDLIFGSELNAPDHTIETQAESFANLLADTNSNRTISGHETALIQRRSYEDESILPRFSFVRNSFMLFIEGSEELELELYKINDDLYCTNNLLATDSTIAQSMLQQFGSALRSLKSRGKALSVDEDSVELLRNLGYVQ